MTELESVNELDSIRQQILRTKELDGLTEKDVCIVLVGNKVRCCWPRSLVALELTTQCDLVSERQVPRDVGVQLSTLWSATPYYETSAAKSINVDEVFHDALLQILRKSAGRPSRSSGKSSRKRSGRCAIL